MEKSEADDQRVSTLAALLVRSDATPAPEAVPVPTRVPAPAHGTEAAIFEEIYPKLRAFAAIVADLDMDPDDLVQDALVATLTRHKLEDLDQPAAYLKLSLIHISEPTRPY